MLVFKIFLQSGINMQLFIKFFLSILQMVKNVTSHSELTSRNVQVYLAL